MPVQAAAGVHDDVCRHLLEHRCTTVLQMREAVGLLVQMQADGVPCSTETDPTQAFVRAEVRTVAAVRLCSRVVLVPQLSARARESHCWAAAVSEKDMCPL